MTKIKKRFQIFILISLLSLSSWASVPTHNDEIIHDMNADNEEVVITPRLGIPAVINNVRETINIKKIENEKANPSAIHPQVVIVGGGTAGLTAALTLSNQGYSVAIIERNTKLGGLASGHERGGVAYSNGDAYYSALIPEQEPLYKQLGLSKYAKTAPIESPSDSLYVEGGLPMPDGTRKFLFLDIWENEKTLEALPASFALTKWAHFKLGKEGLIPNQPIEDARTPYDKMTYEEFLNSQYDMLKRHLKKNSHDKKARDIWNRIKAEIKSGRLNPEIGIMDPVIRYYVNNYGHSALGGHAHEINAAAALNFIYSEMTTRYTHPLGIGEITRRAVELLQSRTKLVTILTSAEAEKIIPHHNTVDTIYIKDGKRFEITSDRVIVSVPIMKAQWLIQDFARLAPHHNRIIEKFIQRGQITDYIVTPVFVDGSPSSVQMTYDLWLGRILGFDRDFPTDFISASWAQFKGYKRKPREPVKYSAITMYHPRGGPFSKYSHDDLINIAERDIDYLKNIYNPYQRAHGEPDLNVRFAEINFWPKSILRPMVDHFADVRTLRKPIAKVIRLAQSNLDTPSHEGAQYRGWRAASDVAEELKEDGIMPPH